MAKVTLTLEDIKREDGTEVVRISAHSDNQGEDYTHAELIGEALLESFGQMSEEQKISKDTSSLN